MSTVGATMKINTDAKGLAEIKNRYEKDDFCMQHKNCGMWNVQFVNGLWWIGSWLVIPRTGGICKNLFWLAHNTLGHFGAKDPLHPLPVPDERGESIAMDLIGPLPANEGYNCILTIMDHLFSHIRIIPCLFDISAEKLTGIFFEHWYCENGLPLNILSNQDTFFLSVCWWALNKVTGVKLKLSWAHDPETDSSSEQLNKMINQCIWYFAQCDQFGWIWALPLAHFNTKYD